MAIHQIRLPLLHLATACILSLGLQVFYDHYRVWIIVILPVLHLSVLSISGLEIFYLYEWAVIISKKICQAHIWLPMLLLAAFWILSLCLQSFYNSFLSSFSLNGRFYPSGKSSFFYDEGFLCTIYCSRVPYRHDHFGRQYPPCCIYKHVKKLKNLSAWKIALLVLALLTLITVIYLLVWYVIRKRRHSRPYPPWVNGDMKRSPTRDTLATKAGNASPSAGVAAGGSPGMVKMRVFDYCLLASATNGFRRNHVLASIDGISSGTMYCGDLISDEGLETAMVIKRFHFSEESCEHVQKNLSGQLIPRHRNLLGPVGYCWKNQALYVVYEYMVNGSLDQHLFAKEPSTKQRLSWAQRCRIVNGVAAGLYYLHKNRSVHGSVKASNILLDQDMTPRLGDFGFSAAAFCPSSAADRCYYTGCTTDIFSFGTVIVDVLCGDGWREERRERGVNVAAFSFLVDRAWDVAGNCRILGAIDEDLAAGTDFDEGEAEKMLRTGMACSHPDPTQRPSMEEVVDFLAGNAPLPEVP